MYCQLGIYLHVFCSYFSMRKSCFLTAGIIDISGTYIFFCFFSCDFSWNQWGILPCKHIEHWAVCFPNQLFATTPVNHSCFRVNVWSDTGHEHAQILLFPNGIFMHNFCVPLWKFTPFYQHPLLVVRFLLSCKPPQSRLSILPEDALLYLADYLWANITHQLFKDSYKWEGL